MKRTKMILVAAIAATFLSAIAAGAAGAGTGTMTLDGTSCNVSFNSTGGPTDPAPNSVSLTNIDDDPVPPCPYDLSPTTNLGMSFDGAGNLVATGAIRVQFAGLGVVCAFSVNSVAGTNGSSTAALNAVIPRTGTFLCPVTSVNWSFTVSSF